MTNDGQAHAEITAGKAWVAVIGAALVLALTLLFGAFAPSDAEAYAGINSFSTVQSDTQAGGHPDIEVHSNFDNRLIQNDQQMPLEPGCGCQDPGRIDIKFPTGFIGNPHSVPRCTLALFSTQACAPESQVGVLAVGLFGGYTPIYNMEPHENEAGLLGFNIPLIGSPSFIVLHGRTDSDYGLTATNDGIFHLLPINELHVYMWGVPALPEHDKFRFPVNQQQCLQVNYPDPCYAPTPSNSPPQPFLQNPTTCGVDLSAGLDVYYYDGTVEHADAPWSKTTGCDQLSFNPSLAAQPTTTQADTSSGLDIELKVPQTQSAFVPSPSQIRATRVTLPPGMSINPNAADGKTSCTDAQGAFGTELAADCPESSKIGTVQIDSSALPGPIDGFIYLGEPKPGERYRIFLAASGFATNVKLSGTVRLDSETGQIVTAFEELPQTPLQRFTMHFFGSERGLMATPEQCGTYEVRSTFVPWNSFLPAQQSLSHFKIESGPGGAPCPGQPRPFDPQVKAGTVDNTAGARTPFALLLRREDGDQNLAALNVATPPGFSGSLVGIPYCPEPALATLGDPLYAGLAELAAPACPAASQIGTAVSGVGASSKPLHLPGKVYLAGPYKGAPLSLVVVVPSVSGPYDLGNVAVRTALHVNPVTAQITAVSDPLPSILDGIPLRIRSVLINLDRPSFTLNPTGCSPRAVQTQVFGDEGATASPASHFQVANCGALEFAPRIGIRLEGNSKRNGHPAIHAVVRLPAGNANLRRTAVTLPPTSLLDQNNLSDVCTRAQFAAGACPPDSVYGQATVETPILDQPLQGPVYLRGNGGARPLPDLVLDLKGQVNVEAVGYVDSVKGGLRTIFPAIPDVPVSKIDLRMQGGARKGLVANSIDLCRNPKRARVVMRGHNGRRAASRPVLRGDCGKARGKHQRKRRRAAISLARKAG